MSIKLDIEKDILRLEKELKKLKEISSRGQIPLSSLSEFIMECENLLYRLSKIKEKDIELNDLKSRVLKVIEEAEILFSSQYKKSKKEFKISSKKKLPELIYFLAIKFKHFWSIYEIITCIMGIFTVFYTLILPIYLVIFFSIPPPFVFPGRPSIIELIVIFLSLIFAFFIHEFSHAISAVLHGGKIEEISFGIGDIIGGEVQVLAKNFINPKNLLFFNSIGMGSNFLLSIIFFFFGILFNYRILFWISIVNGLLAVVNAFPVQPLDGGKVYENIMNNFKNEFIKKILYVLPKSIIVLWVVLLILKIIFS
jgi:Zn-dependent protease